MVGINKVMIPQHYTTTLEPVQRVSKEEAAAWFKVSAVKYFSRAGIKQGVPFEDDWNKGVHCVKRWLELQEGQEPASATEPVYRPLGTHKIPADHRQLADDEVIQDGDMAATNDSTNSPWVTLHKQHHLVGVKVYNSLNCFIFCRPC